MKQSTKTYLTGVCYDLNDIKGRLSSGPIFLVFLLFSPFLLAHLSRSDNVSFCDRSSSVVRRPLTIDLNDISS